MVGSQYIKWWLFYLLLITSVPFATMVVGRYGSQALANKITPIFQHSTLIMRKGLSRMAVGWQTTVKVERLLPVFFQLTASFPGKG